MKNTKISVRQIPEAKIPVEVLAESIVEIGHSMRRIAQSRLSKKAIIVLVASDTGLGKGTVEAVLDGLNGLERTYLK